MKTKTWKSVDEAYSHIMDKPHPRRALCEIVYENIEQGETGFVIDLVKRWEETTISL